MVAELRAVGGERALRAIDESWATIAEREEAGYITDAMISHRLRLLGLEREMRQAGTVSGTPRVRAFAFSAVEPPTTPELHLVEDARLRVGMELFVHGQTTEWVANRQKLQRAGFVLSMKIQNLADEDRTLKWPVFTASVPFPISRWYVRGEDGEPWDGKLKARESISVRVIGYLGAPLAPETPIDAVIHFESATFHATTRARSRWNRLEPTHTGFRPAERGAPAR